MHARAHNTLTCMTPCTHMQTIPAAPTHVCKTIHPHPHIQYNAHSILLHNYILAAHTSYISEIIAIKQYKSRTHYRYLPTPVCVCVWTERTAIVAKLYIQRSHLTTGTFIYGRRCISPIRTRMNCRHGAWSCLMIYIAR